MAKNIISRAKFRMLVNELINADEELKKIQAEMIAGKKAKGIEISEDYIKFYELRFAKEIYADLKQDFKFLKATKRITLDKKILELRNGEAMK
ncbi:MAG: hypothetical protein QW478_06045 [Candidatus Micrarchaeaceae archaeon]